MGAHPGHPIQCFLELHLSHTLAGSRDISTATLTDAQGNNAYDLSGRRIRPTGQHGIYIVNGKKVLR